MKKRILRFVSTALAAALMVSAVPIDSAFAALSEVKSPAQVTTFKSTTDFEKEYVKAYVTDDTVLKVNYKTPLETTVFRVSLYRSAVGCAAVHGQELRHVFPGVAFVSQHDCERVDHVLDD